MNPSCWSRDRNHRNWAYYFGHVFPVPDFIAHGVTLCPSSHLPCPPIDLLYLLQAAYIKSWSRWRGWSPNYPDSPWATPVQVQAYFSFFTWYILTGCQLCPLFNSHLILMGGAGVLPGVQMKWWSELKVLFKSITPLLSGWKRRAVSLMSYYDSGVTKWCTGSWQTTWQT